MLSGMLFTELVAVSAQVKGTTRKLAKTALLAQCLRQLAADERAIGARYLAGELPQRTGIGYATVAEVMRQVQAAREAQLTLSEVDQRFEAIAALSGDGSGAARKAQFGALLTRATEAEAKFLGQLALGELRQGALDGLVVEAIAKAAEQPAQTVRRAYMLTSDLGEVAALALSGSAEALSNVHLRVFRPVLPMLAQTADTAAAALTQLGGTAALEVKLDGFRVQLHKEGEHVRVYSRAQNDVTDYIPEVLAEVAALPSRNLILDGEALVLGPKGRPLPFQDTMHRFGKNGIALREELPLTLKLFDVLLVDDQTLLEAPAQTRFKVLADVAQAHTVERITTTDRDEASAFYDRAIAHGQEGIMVKALDAPYDAGSRGAAWLKVKKVHRLDLVVLAAEWGSGRRQGYLSNIHLGARDPATGQFVMLGKTFKGMTDEMLSWQTAAFLAREIGRDGHIVYVRPEIVVEIAFNDVQRSPRYPAGLALRLARVVGYREDKVAAEADSIETVRAIAVADGVLPES
jgi:DNA ligase-1